jgi:hypothetical protein
MVLATYIWDFAISERATLSVESLKDTVTLCVLLNQICVKPLGKVVHLALTCIVDPSSSEIDYALPFRQRLAPGLSSHPIARFEDHASVSFTHDIVCSRKTSESGSNNYDID